jgi:hypothetical protein
MQWKVPATKEKGTKPNGPTEEETFKKTRSPAYNTSKVAENVQASGRSKEKKKSWKERDNVKDISKMGW